MSTEVNKAIMRHAFEELMNRQNLAVVDEYMTSDFIHHGPGTRVIHGSEHFKNPVVHRAFPDLYFAIEDMIAEGDKVVTRWTIRGTHRGEFMGLPPTGNQVSWAGINITRLVDGKAVEDWVEQDTPGLMQQLTGTIPPRQSEG